VALNSIAILLTHRNFIMCAVLEVVT
jgi:hypothetical protein